MSRWRLVAALVMGLAVAAEPAVATGGIAPTPVLLTLNPAANTQVNILNAARFPDVPSGWLASGTLIPLAGNDSSYGTADPYAYVTQYWDGAAWQPGLSGTFTVPVSTAVVPVGIDVVLAPSGTPVTTVTVKEHDDDPLSGVAISYLDGYWRGLGSTNGSGQVTSDKLKTGTRVRAERGGTVAEQTIGASGVVFHTTEMTASAAKDDDTALPGVAVSYLAGYYRGIGSTGSGGTVAVELFPTTGVTWRGEYGGSAQAKVAAIPGNSAMGGTHGTVAFSSTLVTINALKSDGTTPLQGVAVSYLAGYYRGIGSTNALGVVTCELFDDGTRTFRAEYGGTSATQPVTVASGAGATFYTSALELWAHKSNGDNLPGVAMSYCAGYYRGVGSTASAVVAQLFPTADVPVRAEYGGTSAQQTVTVPGDGISAGASVRLDFYTTSVSVWAKDATGAAINGVAMSYLAGYYRGIGSTTGGGPAVANLFGGTYDFRAEYGGTVGSKPGEVIDGGADGALGGVVDTVTFQITKCTLWYNAAGRSVSYVAGYERGIGNPEAFWLFDGTYTFRFGHSGAPKAETSITIAGPAFKASVAIIKVLNNAGAIMAPSKAEAYWSGWKNAPVDAVSKLAVAVMPSATPVGSTYFAAVINNGRQEKYTSIATNSIVVFQAKLVSIVLKNGAGTAELVGDAQWYAGGWQNAGPTTAQVFLLPGNYYFSVNHGGMRQEKYITISSTGTAQEVLFQTVLTTVSLVESDGVTPIATAAQYYASGWKDMPGTNIAKELLPGNYYFAVSYRGMRQEKYVTVPDGAGTFTAPFATVAVTVKLRNGNGTTGGLTAPKSAQFYASGWKDMVINAAEELLPGNYYFAVNYKGMRQERYVTVNASMDVLFQTVAVYLKLANHTHTSWINTGVAMQFYASGWQDTGVNSGEQLLPGNYYFACTYAGMRQERYVPVPVGGSGSGTMAVEFQTALVDSTSGLCTQYYASGWKAFTDPMELLPGNYYFKYATGDIYRSVSGTNYAIP